MAPAIGWCTVSPVIVQAVDASGRTSGVTTDGGLRLDIPSSTHAVFAENEGGVLPAPAAALAVHARHAGMFDLTIEETGLGGTVVARAVFEDVPVAASSRARVGLATGPASAVLELDVEGDGVTDVALSPGPIPVPVALAVFSRVVAITPLPTGMATSLLTRIEAAANAMVTGNLAIARAQMKAAASELRGVLRKRPSLEAETGLAAVAAAIALRIR
jgi:hypothetical protein